RGPPGSPSRLSGRVRAPGSPRPRRGRPGCSSLRGTRARGRSAGSRTRRRSRRARVSASPPRAAPARSDRPRGRRSCSRLASGGQCRGGMGWTRRGRKGAFRYVDDRGRQIRAPEKIERIERLAIPPAWKDVWIAPGPRAKLQATGYDKAGRKQYVYHADYRAAQEQAKYDNLIRFAEQLPALRKAMADDLDRDELDRERVSAIALRLINLGWFRVGSERYAKESRTFGITTLTRRHVEVRGQRIRLAFKGKHSIAVRTE